MNIAFTVVWGIVGIIGYFTGWQNSIVALWWLSVAALMMPGITNEFQDWKKKRKEEK